MPVIISGSGGISSPIITSSKFQDLLGNSLAGYGFFKADQYSAAFSKTGNNTIEVKAGTVVGFADGTQRQFTANTNISMPTLTAGTDYAIWCNRDGSIQATASFTSAPALGSRVIGGFHYAPGGNATAQAGGNTSAQINEYSIWDDKFRPVCADPRGMTLVGGTFWADIYLTGVDAITNGSSRYNVSIADGSSPPKVPVMFGGNGSATYGSYTWFEAMELAFAFGKKCPTQQEFMALAYGTTEATSSGGSDVPTTGVTGTGATSAWNLFTSKWGVVQSTGCIWAWGQERGGIYNTTGAWQANTEGRGSEYAGPSGALLGGGWDSTSNSGSRCSVWSNAASVSSASIGSRFVCDHLSLE